MHEDRIRLSKNTRQRHHILNRVLLILNDWQQYSDYLLAAYLYAFLLYPTVL